MSFEQLANRFGFEIVEVKCLTFNFSQDIKQRIMNLLGSFNKCFNQNFVLILKFEK